jgi:hypothetical protein
MIRSYASLLTWLGLTIVASVALYHTSDRVNALDQQLHSLNAQIDAEQESLHVLKAEWVYLANPARVEAETLRHLDLQPTAPNRVAALQNIGDLLPLHNGVEPAPQIRTAEAAPAPARIQRTTPVVQAQAPTPHTKFDRVIASINEGRINDHMMMQHTASSEAPTDKIGALINTMSLHP